MHCLFNRDVITRYYFEGYAYKHILLFVKEYHGIDISMRTLLRRLADLGLRRRGHPASLVDIWRAVTLELTGPGLLTLETLRWLL